MRLLLISHLFPTPANPGAGTFIHDQAQALAALGCQVQVICPTLYAPPGLGDLHPRWRRLRQVPTHAEVGGLPVYYPRYLSFPRMALFSWYGHFCARGIASLAEAEQLGYDCDLIHAHTALPDGRAASLLNRRWRKPLLITVHGYDAVQLNRGRLRRRQILAAFSATDRVVCVSEKLVRECRAHDPSPDRFRVIHNGFQLPEIPPEEAPPRADGPLILSVANLIPLKGHRYVLEAVAALRRELPGIRYRLVGDGYARTELESLVRRLGLSEVVEFVGRLPHEAVMRHYRECDIFALPSSPEGFGVVYLEAMAHGKPVIACQGEGISDIVTDGQTGLLVPPRDTAALTAAMRTLLTDPARAHRMGEAGREVALQYTWQRNAQQTMDLYREVVGAAS